MTEKELKEQIKYWKSQGNNWLGKWYAHVQVQKLKLELKKLKKSNK